MRLSITALALTGGILAWLSANASELPVQSATHTRFEPTPHSAALAVAHAAFERTSHQVRYNGAYRSLDYPNGDVPAGEGVCTDVVIRTYRALGIDLQQLVHEDMAANFSAYPTRWGLTRPDSNIDHRRVPNLETFFEREAARPNQTATALSLRPSANPGDYQPGDIVSWRLADGLPHIGVVANTRIGPHPADRYAIVHNIGRGPELEDVLFSWTIIGHYRYLPIESHSN